MHSSFGGTADLVPLSVAREDAPVKDEPGEEELLESASAAMTLSDGAIWGCDSGCFARAVPQYFLGLGWAG